MNVLKKLINQLDNIDSDCDTIVDTYLIENYYYMIQISGLYPYLRNWGWIIAFVHFVLIYLSTILCITMLLLPVTELLKESIVIFSQNLHMVSIMLFFLYNLIYIQFRRGKIAKCIKAIATGMFVYNEPFRGDVVRLKKEMMRQRKMWMLVPLSVSVGGGTVLLMAPTIDSYGHFDFSKISSSVNLNMIYPFFKCPFSLENDIIYYFVNITQLSVCGAMLLFLMMGMTGYIILCQEIILEMKILKDYVRNIEKRALMEVTLLYNIQLNLPDHLLYEHPLFITCYEKCLKNNFKHHQEILRFFNYFCSIFSFCFFTTYVNGSITIALSLLSTGSWNELPGTTISSFSLFGIEIFLVYTLCYFAQKMTDMNEELRDEMYSTKWYYCNAGIRRSINIFQQMTLRPMVLKGCGIVPANMESFSKIVNGAYSYYNMLNVFRSE